MQKSTSPTMPEQKARARPLHLKIYTYGNVEFVLYQGGQPARSFNINWMREKPSGSDDAIASDPGLPIAVQGD